MELTKMDRRIAGLRMTKLITCNALVLLLFVSLLDFSDCTANFGFDSANSCSPNGKMSRRGRAQMLAAIPCDLGKQPFCHLPGSIYPWHAVRRFVHENQGLMKRMYGDVRHISILRGEIQNNEVPDVDDIEDTADRYSKMPRGAKFMLHGRDADREDYGGYKGNDVLMQPHFRPVSTSTTTTTQATTTSATPSTTSATSSTTTIAPPAVAVAEPQREKDTGTESESEHERPSLESNSVYELPSSSTTTTTSSSTTRPQSQPQPTVRSGDNIQIIDSPQLGASPNGIEGSLRNLSIAAVPATLATVVKATTVPAKRTTTMSIRKNPTPTTATPTAVKAAPKATTTTTAATMSSGSTTSSTTTAVLLPRRNATKTTLGSTTPVSFASLFSSTFTALSADKQRRPLTTSTTAAPPPPSMSSTKAGLLREGGQLFQDAMKQEPMAVSSNMRGVNACPVKDEVVAPFWANNTRGEVLALLNLYPFEQYVHWEKCTHEFKQMFCRDGCRCEQQYRLHRLLAYDPHNECRGIFSDWFRFPSSCICKCYNIPMEFRATSRSPRSDSSFDAPQSPPPADPIASAEAEVQRAIYEHATDQWYRPRDEFDFFEG